MVKITCNLDVQREERERKRYIQSVPIISDRLDDIKIDIFHHTRENETLSAMDTCAGSTSDRCGFESQLIQLLEY